MNLICSLYFASWICLSQPVPITTHYDCGIASYYDYDLNRADQKCRSNDCYSMFNATCASRDYPRGTILRVSYKDEYIDCRVNDYGPELSTGRIIDLSSYSFGQIAPLKLGIIKVKIEKIW